MTSQGSSPFGLAFQPNTVGSSSTLLGYWLPDGLLERGGQRACLKSGLRFPHRGATVPQQSTPLRYLAQSLGRGILRLQFCPRSGTFRSPVIPTRLPRNPGTRDRSVTPVGGRSETEVRAGPAWSRSSPGQPGRSRRQPPRKVPGRRRRPELPGRL